MPLRNFEKELGKRKHILNYDLDVLKKCTIGVDGAWFVRKYSPTMKNQNILFDGFAKEILSCVQALLESMEEIECRIVWIWNGISPRLDVRKSPEERRKEALQLGWSYHLEKNTESEKKVWSTAFGYEEVKMAINPLLMKYKVEIINAPYLAAGQGAYIAKKGYIDMFFGATDYFLFSGGDKLILDFEFTQCQDRKMVTKIHAAVFSAFYSDFGISSQYKAREIFLLLGSEYCPTTPDYSMSFDIATICTRYKEVGGIVSSLRKQEEMLEKAKGYSKMYQSAKCVVDFHPVFGENNELVYLSGAEPVPHDMGIIFGKRLPDSLYSLFVKGSISLEYITGLAMDSVSTICTPNVFESIEGVVSQLYPKSVNIRISCLGMNEIVCVPDVSDCSNSMHESDDRKVPNKEKEEAVCEKEISSEETVHPCEPSDSLMHRAEEASEEDERSGATDSGRILKISEIAGRELDCSSAIPVAIQWLFVFLDNSDRSMLDKAFAFSPVTSEIKPDEEIDWEVFECSESFKFAITSIQNKLRLENIEQDIKPIRINCINGWRMEEILVGLRKKKEDTFTPEQKSLILSNLEFMKGLHEFFVKNIKSNRHKRELEALIAYASELK